MTRPTPKKRRVQFACSPPPERSVSHHFDKGDSVTLIVGPEKHEMLVHANFIVQNSEFFKAAFRKEWREGQERTITMPEEDYETMTNYINFVYTEKLPTVHLAHTGSGSPIQPSCSSLAELYVLGTRLLDSFIENAILEEFRRVTDLFNGKMVAMVLSHEAVNAIYSGTCQGNAARLLMVEIYAKNARRDQLGSEYDQTFVLDLANKLLRS